jgi:hypothetical protein
MMGKQEKEFHSLDSQIIAEWTWHIEKKPYYCIHPKLVSKLCKTKIDKIPVSLVKMPEPFDVILIRFKEENELLSIEKGKYFLRTMLVSLRKKNGEFNRKGKKICQFKDNDLTFWFDFGEKGDNGYSILTFKTIRIHENQTIEQMFDFLPSSPTIDEGLHIPNEVLRNAVGLFISAGFLASADDASLLYPDIISKYRSEFEKSDENRKEEIIKISHKKDKVGWFIGFDEMFKESSNVSDGMKWAHIREGHPHTYLYGTGKKLVKIRWVEPTTIRPDLPFKA